jgi:D-alanyl-D-alanine carboxypeptidase (penicillin-binding protein 5/6)
MNVDGLKTGHTDVGGYGLTASAVRDGRRVFMVLNGMDDMQARADESAKVLDYGYREYGLYPIAKEGDIMATPKVWLGQAPTVQIVAADDAVVTLPRSSRSGLRAVVSFDQPIAAPIKKGQQVGVLIISVQGMDSKSIPLVASTDVDQAGFFSRFFTKLGVIFGGTKT